MGGAARYITSLSTAIKAFIDRYYPRAGKKGLLVVPELPSTTEGITWEEVTRHMVQERHGGLLAGMRVSSVMLISIFSSADPTIQNTANSVNMDPAKRKTLEDLMKKNCGEEAERATLLPLLEEFKDQDVTVICGQKSNMELVEDTISKELAKDAMTQVNREMAVVEKTAQVFGISLDIPDIEAEVQNMMAEFLGLVGPQPVATMVTRMVAVQQVGSPSGTNRFQKEKRKKDIAMILDILNTATVTQLDMSKELKLRLMTKNLNRMKKEHDLVFIRPESRTIGQFEVKAMRDKSNREVLEALNQLRGGRDELTRVHGHVLDHQWTYVGAVCLPNLPIHLKAEVVRELGICHSCSSYLLVGPMKAPVENLLRNLFPPSSSFPDESVWRPQYEAVTSRLLAMDHLVKPIPDVQRITGRKDPIVAGYTEVDRVVDPITSTAQDIKDMSKEKHIGSPTSIIFLTGDQRQLWGEKKVLLLADYSTG